MRKLVVLFLAISFSAVCPARDCSPDPELDASIAKAESDGEAKMRSLLDQLVAARGMSTEQTSIYLKSMLLREGPRTTQALRMIMASNLASAAKSGRCTEITKAKVNVRAVIITQWNTVNEEIQKDVAVAAGKP